jgi:16S rRNA (guanine527-N7)-methyltransferase
MNNSLSPQLIEFTKALDEHALDYGISLKDEERFKLQCYFEILQLWNARLHLIAPCSASEFATRHILESLIALPFLPSESRVIDIGSGAGIPIIPCLIFRTSLHATLIEASRKKTIFLREALKSIELAENTKIISERFEELPRPTADVLTCRALDRFTQIFQPLIDWSENISSLLLFGGPTIQIQIERTNLPYQAIGLPHTTQRFLFVINMK